MPLDTDTVGATRMALRLPVASLPVPAPGGAPGLLLVVLVSLRGVMDLDVLRPVPTLIPPRTPVDELLAPTFALLPGLSTSATRAFRDVLEGGSIASLDTVVSADCGAP